VSSRPEPGLCGTCVNARRIETRTGSVFVLCEKSRTDPAFPRYPRLPVLACRGYTSARDAGVGAGRPGTADRAPERRGDTGLPLNPDAEQETSLPQERSMTNPFYVSRSRIEIVRNTHRRAQMEAGGQFDTGVHGPVKEHFRLLDEKDLPLPVDYIVAATGA
jgi:hypothetical protein